LAGDIYIEIVLFLDDHIIYHVLTKKYFKDVILMPCNYTTIVALFFKLSFQYFL
jgi:hypothetical protein